MANVIKSNTSYLDFIRQTAARTEKENQSIDLLHLRNFLNAWFVKINPEDNKFKLFFADELRNVEYLLAEKP